MDTASPPPARTGRPASAMRPLELRVGVLAHPAGSAEIRFGGTRVLCSASVDSPPPPFAEAQGTGWVTAEYAMLPGATHTRGRRGPSGRSQEISRLVGRALRQAVDLRALAGFVITVDCDVIEADGGTRTASISGGYVALAQAVSTLVREGRVPQGALGEPLAAVSVGLVGGEARLDLDYSEDSVAEVDLNLAMTASGRIVEIQGTAEGAPFSRAELTTLLDLAEQGISQIVALQRSALGSPEASPPSGPQTIGK